MEVKWWPVKETVLGLLTISVIIVSAAVISQFQRYISETGSNYFFSLVVCGGLLMFESQGEIK